LNSVLITAPDLLIGESREHGASDAGTALITTTATPATPDAAARPPNQCPCWVHGLAEQAPGASKALGCAGRARGSQPAGIGRSA
jgi:hypothetical protein